ncbi:MAG: helix-turn-helix transcriptional regulator [Bacteroidota bacterium]
MQPPEASIQSIFLEKVRKRLTPNISFADELAEVLNISRDSAYRRIRGETILSLDEAKKLYDRYAVSIDSLFTVSSNMVPFYHRALTPEYTLGQWLNSVAKNLEEANHYEKKQMIIAAKDIPIFHYFRLPELSAFKIFFWLKSIIKDPAFANELYRAEAVPVELTQAGNRIWDSYAGMPSTEIWSDEAINDTLKQIEFYGECSFFAKPNQAAALCDQLIKLNNEIREEAAEGKKTDGSSFKLYVNEIFIADNTVLAHMDQKRSVYVSYNLLNLLTTFQESFCEKTELYLNNMIKNSTLISATAEKERNKFFNMMNERIEVFKKKL